MLRELPYYQTQAAALAARDRGRDAMLAAMDKMWRGEWDLPRPMRALGWVHKVVSSDPHDALRAGTRVLSSVSPQIHVQPLGTDENARAQADSLERALGWHLAQAGRRRRANVLRDVVLSALLYDEIAAQVVYLPHQIRAVRAFGGDTRRLEAARRYGPFAVLVRNPRQVHVRYSDWMPEAVLYKREMPLQEAVDFWGPKAGAKLVGDAPVEDKFVTLYDYTDLHARVVWGAGAPGRRDGRTGRRGGRTAARAV